MQVKQSRSNNVGWDWYLSSSDRRQWLLFKWPGLWEEGLHAPGTYRL